MSVITFIMMGIDKQYAIRNKRRIPERRLWIFALLGGGIGGYLGMKKYRHKTQHVQFRLGFPVLALLYGSLLIILFL